MNIKELFVDASKYAASDWTKFIFLGILFVGADLLDRTTAEKIPYPLWIILIILFIFLFFVQTGYIFRIIETSAIHGSDKLPPFNHVKELFAHGMKDTVVVGCYITFPMALLAFFTGIFIAYFNMNILITFPFIVILIFAIMQLTSFILMQGAILNMVHNHGKLSSAFNFKSIIMKIRDLGLKKFLIVCILAGVIFVIVEPFILDELRTYLDLTSGTILELIVAPYLAILTSRFLGTMDRY